MRGPPKSPNVTPANMSLQELRNALCEVEDTARQRRNQTSDEGLYEAFNQLQRLCKLIREEIVQ